MARGGRSSWQLAKILQDITWDAGLVVRSAFRGLHKPRKKKIKPKDERYVRFIHKGQFYRRPIAPRKKKSDPPKLMKLPPAGPQVVPQPFKTPPSEKVVAQKVEALVAAAKPGASKAGVGGGAGGAGGSSRQSTWSWRSWWRLNAPLVILNFGSVATLLGFTRPDILELRSLAVTGNCSFVIYSLLQPPPIRWTAASWAALFASVNGFHIAKILNERRGKVYLTPHQEEIFHEHFQPHGVTPKQFEKVMSMGTSRIIKKGDVLSRQGETMSSVKLVVYGDTRANIMGRHLTAMGSVKGNRYSMQGGNSGAWIGEMAFLQSLWDKDHAPKHIQKKLSGQNKPGASTTEDSNETASAGATEDDAHRGIIRSGLPPSDEPYKYCAISTIVAVEDIELIEWSFEDMKKVMKSSRDIQDSITRSMTAAIVGKVVNFMVSRQSAIPKWSTMLDNWKHASPRHKNDGDEVDILDEEEEDISPSLQGQPLATSAAWLLRQATRPLREGVQNESARQTARDIGP